MSIKNCVCGKKSCIVEDEHYYSVIIGHIEKFCGGARKKNNFFFNKLEPLDLSHKKMRKIPKCLLLMSYLQLIKNYEFCTDTLIPSLEEHVDVQKTEKVMLKLKDLLYKKEHSIIDMNKTISILEEDKLNLQRENKKLKRQIKNLIWKEDNKEEEIKDEEELENITEDDNKLDILNKYASIDNYLLDKNVNIKDFATNYSSDKNVINNIKYKFFDLRNKRNLIAHTTNMKITSDDEFIATLHSI